MEQSGIPCVNCKTPVSPDDAKMYAQIFLCESCARTAEVVSTRFDQSIDRLKVIKHELIRHMLVAGQLQLNAAEASEMSRKDLFSVLSKEAEKFEEKTNQWHPKSPSTTPSKGSTKQPVSTVHGRPKSS